MRMWIAWLGVVVLCVVGGCGGVGDDWQEHDFSADAYSYVVDEYVTPRLRVPGSAKFPSSGEQEDHVMRIPDSQQYVIRSWVDAENALGVSIRTQWTATVELVEFEEEGLFKLRRWVWKTHGFEM